MATLTSPDTWSCPILGLACVLMSRPISPELVLFPDFRVSNIPRYFSFASWYKTTFSLFSLIQVIGMNTVSGLMIMSYIQRLCTIQTQGIPKFTIRLVFKLAMGVLESYTGEHHRNSLLLVTPCHSVIVLLHFGVFLLLYRLILVSYSVCPYKVTRLSRYIWFTVLWLNPFMAYKLL